VKGNVPELDGGTEASILPFQPSLNGSKTRDWVSLICAGVSFPRYWSRHLGCI
jgi:hypothetical protein